MGATRHTGHGERGHGSGWLLHPRFAHTGHTEHLGLIFNGTPAVISSGCGTPPIITGGALAGQFTIGVTSACNAVITPGVTAPNGWACSMRDVTTPAATFAQTGSTTTTATFTQTGTSVATDKVIFNCVEY